MKTTITVTRKGQATLPIAIRRRLGLGAAGGILPIWFDERKGTLIIAKPIGVAELSERVSRHLRPKTKPLTDVDAYYQRHRTPRA